MIPLVDHRLITAADVGDLPRQYCSATMAQFLVRILQLTHEDGNVIQIPDNRPQVPRLHDAFEEACARLLKSGDQPSAGGVPASVIVTISLEELLAKAGLAETADGTQFTPRSCCGLPMKPRSGPPSSIATVSRWRSVEPAG